jgi:hypothetical protein
MGVVNGWAGLTGRSTRHPESSEGATVAHSISTIMTWEEHGAEVGMLVEVRGRYLGNWCRGFEVAEVLYEGCRVRRRSDQSVLPDIFPYEEVRQAQPAGARSRSRAFSGAFASLGI